MVRSNSYTNIYTHMTLQKLTLLILICLTGFSSLYQQGSANTYGAIGNGWYSGWHYRWETWHYYYIQNYNCGPSIFFPGGTWADFNRATWSRILPSCVRAFVVVYVSSGGATACPWGSVVSDYSMQVMHGATWWIRSGFPETTGAPIAGNGSWMYCQIY
jgi:hypothetical protein